MAETVPFWVTALALELPESVFEDVRKRILALRAENERLRGALGEIESLPGVVFGGGKESPWFNAYKKCKDIARQALAPDTGSTGGADE